MDMGACRQITEQQCKSGQKCKLYRVGDYEMDQNKKPDELELIWLDQ